MGAGEYDQYFSLFESSAAGIGFGKMADQTYLAPVFSNHQRRVRCRDFAFDRHRNRGEVVTAHERDNLVLVADFEMSRCIHQTVKSGVSIHFKMPRGAALKPSTSMRTRPAFANSTCRSGQPAR